MSSIPSAGGQPASALRLTFSYSSGGVVLDGVQGLDVPTQPSDPVEHGPESGFWVELLDANNGTLYRKVVENPIRFGEEVFSPEGEIVRQQVGTIAGSFDLLVPQFAELASVALWTSPLNPESFAEAASQFVVFPLENTGGVA